MSQGGNQRRVLITGASGFIGSWLLSRFLSQGWDAWGIGRRSLDRDRYRTLGMGCENESLAGRLAACEIPSPDVIVHAAARSSPWGTKQQFHCDNLLATRQVVQYAQEHRDCRVVFISSSSVLYRPTHQFSLDEQTPFATPPVNRYAATKQQCEKLIESLGTRATILRPRAVFGPGDTVLLPRILEAARAGRLPWIRSSQPIIGDLVYIENLVDVVQAAAADDSVHGLYHVTNAEPVEIRKFLGEVFEELGIEQPKRRVRVTTAMWAAGLLEGWHAAFKPATEPPITRFGVHVFAYSKTFDPTKQLARFGPPRISLHQGLEKTVAALRDNS